MKTEKQFIIFENRFSQFHEMKDWLINMIKSNKERNGIFDFVTIEERENTITFYFLDDTIFENFIKKWSR